MVYRNLDTSRVKRQFTKVKDAIERDDFKTADIKKLAQGTYYRAKLDDTNRLLLTFVQYSDETVCLALEVIHQHAYDKSRFLRGARIDESKLPTLNTQEFEDAPPIRYLHPTRNTFHVLDKIISFDDLQDSVYHTPTPIILVGSAGSGKTALTLQKLREVSGQVLYVTLSEYLAQNARTVYSSHHFENEKQDVQFLSFSEFLKTIRVPEGREVNFDDFRVWISQQKGLKKHDAHQFFEEFRGVLVSQPSGVLNREEYLKRGVRQSIFPPQDRSHIYDVFEQYLMWLKRSNLYDSSLLASSYLPKIIPSFDFIVVDEVQDLTAAQLALILRSSNKIGQFLLCGDSNQIVHPNFFSWASVKTLLYHDPTLAEQQVISILRANFRNASQITQVANDILRIKHSRFGSVDRESNFLVESIANDQGSVTFLPDQEETKQHLNDQISESTDYAVLVLRDEDKREAKRIFETPLIFSVHEAKGLEYQNIILYNFVSSQQKIFLELTNGVTRDDLAISELKYKRNRDKTDKSLEIYKFYVNALYVAITRAIDRVIFIEHNTKHPLLKLLGIELGDQNEKLKAKKASRDDWEREARKLELQGKKEQAIDIRHRILKQKPVPWSIWTPEHLLKLEDTIRSGLQDKKAIRSLLDFALLNQQEKLLEDLSELKIKPAMSFLRNNEKDRRIQRQAVLDKYRKDYMGVSTKAVLNDCDKYGVDHRTPENLTPLMLAVDAGNLPLVEALLERGADPNQTDLFGRTAHMQALARAHSDAYYAQTFLGVMYERVCPNALDVLSHDKLVRLNSEQGEFYVLSLMLGLWPHFHSCLFEPLPTTPVEEAKRKKGYYLDYLQHHQDFFPPNVLREQRRKRTYWNHLLARAEVDSSYQPSRKLWQRAQKGFYLPHSSLQVRLKMGQPQPDQQQQGQEEWVNVGLLVDPVARAWMARQ